MAELTFTFEHRALERLQRGLENLEDTHPLMDEIGNRLVEDFRMGFRQSKAPDNTPWEPLKVREGKPLLDTGVLRNSINYRATEDSVTVGTNVRYGLLQHTGITITAKPGNVGVNKLGPRKGAKMLRFMGPRGPIFAKKVTIPPRPFVGIHDRQIRKINRAIKGWADEVLNAIG